jgi:signal transduction histidine kinase
MDELVDDILTLAREGASLDTDRVESVSIEHVAHETWATVNTKGATLVVTDDITVEADENRLRQLFANCVRNTVEHGMADDAGTAALTVRVGALADDAGFFIEDDGVGLPDSVADDLFEAGVTTAEDGTGFGLAIVRTVAEAHGWVVTATTAEGGGARFEFRT